MDKQKVKAGDVLAAACERLDLPRPVFERARGLFAAFRDARQNVTSLNETVAACLVAAFEECVFYRVIAERARDRERERERDVDGDGDGDGGGAGAVGGAGAGAEIGRAHV